MKKLISLLILFFIQNAGYSQNEVALDSTVIKTVDSLIALSKSLWYVDTDSAEVIADYALSYSEQHNYLTGEGRSYSSLGAISNLRGDDVKSVAYFKDAADIFEGLGNDLYSAMIRSNIGNLLLEDEQFEEALIYTLKSHDYYLKNDLEHLLVNSYSIMGVIFIRQGRDLDETMEKLNEGAKFAKQYGDTLQLIQLYNSMGIAHVKKNIDIEFAILNFEEAIRILKIKQKDDNFIGLSYMGLGEAYLKSGDLKKAILYNDTALQKFEAMNYIKGLQEVYESRKDILEAQGDYKRGFEAYEKFIYYNDSLYSRNRANQLNRIRTEYDTERKEAEITSLSQQASIQGLEIRQKNQVMIIGVIILLLAIVSVYFIYKQRSSIREKQKTELEQRFLRSQLNPHFISNALVAVQNYMLKNQTETASTYLAKFSKLMREILKNSRKEFIPVEDEIEMLTNFLDIHKLRMNDDFDYKIEIDQNIDREADTIPPMFIQPFVENAIEHGIINANGKGLIEINLIKGKEYISIEIKDNGGGLQANVKSQHHNSVSSTIIQERMALFNKTLKNKIQLIIGDIKNEQGDIQGAKVELMVPFGYN